MRNKAKVTSTPTEMANEGSNQDGFLKWRVKHSDGTRPTRNFCEEDRKWFLESMQAQSVDVVKRTKEISVVMRMTEKVLEQKGVTPSDLEDMLDELQDHVKSTDIVNDPHFIEGFVLKPLLGYLKNSHSNIRSKAADVLTTMVQSHEYVIHVVSYDFEPLIKCITSDPIETVRMKVINAISCIIRQHETCIAAFRLGDGYLGLIDALSCKSVSFQREVLELLRYMLCESSADCDLTMELGFSRIMLPFASSKDGEVRKAALKVLFQLAKDGRSEKLCAGDKKIISRVLEERIKYFQEQSADDQDAALEERKLLLSLVHECFDS